MPGTIHVSVLELVGLPSSPQNSSMGVKVSMGKQAHELRDNEETSLSLASLRDNLNVSIHDFDGNEIAHTDVETRSIVEKVVWDDLFPLKGGGNIRLRLHFILTEDEQNRIRIMRESAARKKQEDLLKRRHSIADLARASGGSPASSQDPPRSRPQTKERSVDPSDSQALKISSQSHNDRFLKKAELGQKKQAFSTSKSTGALDKLAAYQDLKERIQGQDAEQQSDQLDKTPSNIRKMILAFESSPVKEESPATNITRETPQPQLSSSATVDIPAKLPSLKKTVAVNTIPVISKLETALALSTPQEIEKERGKLLSATNKAREIALLSSNTGVNIPSKMPILKKTVTISNEPVLTNLEKAQAPSTSEEIGKELGKPLPASSDMKETSQFNRDTALNTPSNMPSLTKTVAVDSKPVLSDLETAPAPPIPSAPEEIGKESGKFLPADNTTKEVSGLSSNTSLNTPSKMPILKKTLAIRTKPVFSNLERAQAPSTPEEVVKESRKLVPANHKLKEPTQVSSNTSVENPSKVPRLKETVSVYYKPIWPNLETASAPSTPEEIEKEKGKLLSATTDETAQLSCDAAVHSPPKVSSLKKTDVVSNKPGLSKFKTTPAPSAPEDLEKESEKLIPKLTSDTKMDTSFKVPILKKVVAVNLEIVPDPPEPKVTRKERGEDKDCGASHQEICDEKNISKTQPTKKEIKEENNSMEKLHTSSVSEKSIFSLKTLIAALPRRKKLSTDFFSEKCGLTTSDPSVIENKWRSKRWKSSQHNIKSKLIHGNEQYSIDSRGWFFLDEMIHSCVRSDDRSFVDALEGCLSNCSQDNEQEKLSDAQSKCEKDFTESKNPESSRRHNNIFISGQAGQVMKIAIMVGFGFLVFLTRQGK